MPDLQCPKPTLDKPLILGLLLEYRHITTVTRKREQLDSAIKNLEAYYDRKG